MRGWANFRLVACTLGLLAVVGPAGLAAAACPTTPLPPCSRVTFTASFSRSAPWCATTKLPICSPQLGLRGPKGLRGFRGWMGPAGKAGDVGQTGPSGATGDTGATGPPGGPGDAGASTGLPGPAGLPGVAGAAGATGPAGPFGPQGTIGPQGLPGLQGSIGLMGPLGPAGPAGGIGATGAQGAPGAVGAPGAAGAAGTTGLAGPAGPAGAAGAAGALGPAGPAGTAGATGALGPAGPAGAAGANGLAEYGYIYNVSAETVALEADVTFDSNGVLTAGITHLAGGAGITVVNAGVYKVSFSASGTEPNQMALFVNGTPIAGTVYASGAGTQQNSGQAIVNLAAGAVMTVRNHSSAAAVGLATPIGGTQPTVNASVVIEKLA
jgi:hypothetical protein